MSTENKERLSRSMNEYNCKLERLIRFLCPDLSLDYLRKNIDLIERSIYSKGEMLNGFNDSKNRLIFDDEKKKENKEYDQVLKNLSTSFVSTADSSFLRFIQENQKSKDIHDYYHSSFREQQQLEELISDDMMENSLAHLPSDLEVLYLVELFLKVCETNYFYIHPQNFLAMLEIFLLEKSQKNLKYLKQNWIFLIILFGVLAIASGYEYIGEGRVLPSVTNSMVGLDDPGKEFYKASLPFVGLLLKSNSIHCVQALLLLGLFLTTNESTHSSPTIHHGYLYVHLSVEKAIVNKLHLNDSNEDFMKREFNARLWWSCYCLERRYGINLGKPEIIKREEITAQLPQHCSFLNQSNGSSNYLNQRAIIELTFIICKISGLLYSKYHTDGYVCLEFKIIKNLLSELEDWRVKYSAIVDNVHTMDPNASLYRANTHLSLNYYLAKLYIGKPFLLHKVENYNSYTNFQKEEVSSIDHLSSICVDSAFKTIQLLCMLNRNSKLGLYSATDLNFCNLSLFVTVLLLKIDKSSSTLLFLRKGLQILKILSMGCASAKVTFSRLSKLELILSNNPDEAHRDDELLDAPFEIPGMASGASNYPDSEIELKSFSLCNEGMESMKLPYSMKIHHDQPAGQSNPTTFPNTAFDNTVNTTSLGDSILSTPDYSDIDPFEDWTKNINYLSFNPSLNN